MTESDPEPTLRTPSLRNPLGQLIASQVAAEAARRSLGKT